MNPRKALLLIGSPKGKASTSRAFGHGLLKRLEAAGLATEEMVVLKELGTPEGCGEMLAAVDAADVVIVSFPLYIDQVPAPLIRAMELIAEHRKIRTSAPAHGPGAARLVAIVQCGFPETHQNGPAVDVMRRFAAAAGFVWAGALAVGMGGAIGGMSLEKAGGMVKNFVRAIDAAAASLADGGLVPEEATALAGKPLMPQWAYLLAANYSMKREARKRGCAGRRLRDRPYPETR